MIFVVLILSFIGGAFGSFIGGASFIMIPALLLTGMAPHIALGTNKLIASSTNLYTIYLFRKDGHLIIPNINFRYVIIVLIIGSILGTMIVPLINQHIISRIIGFIMLFSGIKYFFDKFNPYKRLNAKKRSHFFLRLNTDTHRYWTFFGIGVYSSCVGIGVGPVLWHIAFYQLKLDHIQSVAFLKLAVFIVNITSFIVFATKYDAVDYKIGSLMLIFSLLGAHLGTKILEKIRKDIATNTIYILIIVMGILVLSAK